MATFYVSKSGSDEWDGMAAAWDGTHGPKLTIKAAVAAAGSGTHVLLIDDGSYAESGNIVIGSGAALTLEALNPGGPGVTITGSSIYNVVGVAVGAVSLTLRRLTIETEIATACVQNTSATTSVVLDDVHVVNHKSNGTCILYSHTAGTGRHLTILDGSLACTHATPCALIQILLGCGRITINGGLWSGACTGIELNGAVGGLDLAGCDLALDAGTLINAQIGGGPRLTATMDYLAVRNCTGRVRSLLMLAEYVRFLEFAGNELLCTNTGSSSFQVGYEPSTASPEKVNEHPVVAGRIVGNRWHFSGPGANHLLFLGVGAERFTIAGNRFTSDSTSAYGMVVKSHHHVIEGNLLACGNGYTLYLCGGSYNQVRGNTIACTGSGMPLVLDVHQEAAFSAESGRPRCNVLENNIVVSAGGSALAYSDHAEGPAWANVLDRNLYWTGAVTVAVIGEVSVPRTAGAAGLRDRWSAYAEQGSWMRRNDAGSLVADPGFAEALAGDYRLLPGSAARRAGLPAGLDLGGVHGPYGIGEDSSVIEMQLNESDAGLRALAVVLRDAADNLTPRAGLEPVAQICKAGEASFAVIVGTVTEVGGGVYRIALGAADVDSPGHAVLMVEAVGAVTRFVDLDVVRYRGEVHLAKAALANSRRHVIDTGADTILDDDGQTPLRTLTPTEADGVVTVAVN